MSPMWGAVEGDQKAGRDDTKPHVGERVKGDDWGVRGHCHNTDVVAVVADVSPIVITPDWCSLVGAKNRPTSVG